MLETLSNKLKVYKRKKEIRDLQAKGFSLQHLYFGYLGYIKQIDEYSYTFDQKMTNPIILAYKIDFEVLEYKQTPVTFKEYFQDCFNNEKYNSYLSQEATIKDGELVFAPIDLIADYLSTEERLKNKVSYMRTIEMLDYLNNALQKINYSEVFETQPRIKHSPGKIPEPNKVEFVHYDLDHYEVLTDVQNNKKLLKKNNIFL